MRGRHSKNIAMESGFWIFVLEGAVALALLVFIVWWTLPKKSPRGGDEES